MTETIRVYDLAKELGKTNKEVIEKLDSLLGVKVKSHSSVISSIQANKLKQLLSEPKAETSKKPKAFIVKKAKVKEDDPKEENTPPSAEEEKPKEKRVKSNSRNRRRNNPNRLTKAKKQLKPKAL